MFFFTTQERVKMVVQLLRPLQFQCFDHFANVAFVELYHFAFHVKLSQYLFENWNRPRQYSTVMVIRCKIQA
jgi:hypothetical protein